MLPFLLNLAGREGAGSFSACFDRDLLEAEDPIRVAYCAFNLAIKLLGDTWNGRRMRNHRNFSLFVERLGITSCNFATFNLLLFTTNCVSSTRVYFRRFNTLDMLPWIPIPISISNTSSAFQFQVPSNSQMLQATSTTYIQHQKRWCLDPVSSWLSLPQKQLPVQVLICLWRLEMAGSLYSKMQRAHVYAQELDPGVKFSAANNSQMLATWTNSIIQLQRQMALSLWMTMQWVHGCAQDVDPGAKSLLRTHRCLLLRQIISSSKTRHWLCLPQNFVREDWKWRDA